MTRTIHGLLLTLCALTIAAPIASAQESTAAMLAAATKEGKVTWYTSVDVKVAEAVAKAFRAEYPGIDIEVERSGSERVFQRINQEYQSGIHNVDVVNSSDASRRSTGTGPRCSTARGASPASPRPT